MTFYCAPCDRICAESGTCPVCDEIVREFEPAEVHLTAGVFQPAFTPALPTYGHYELPAYDEKFLRVRQAS